MAFPSLAFKFIVACQFLSLVFQARCTAIDLGSESSSKPVSDKVNVSVYYKALDSTCATFIVRDLSQIFNDGLSDIVNLRLVPGGDISHANQSNNATNVCQVIICRNKNGVFVFGSFFLFLKTMGYLFFLQSGSDECQLSTLQACSINAFPDLVRIIYLYYYLLQK